MKTRITIVCDNYSWGGLRVIAEHGFAVYIEQDNRGILFDTGQGLGLVNNLRRLNINIAKVNNVIISHGHYDHTGGLLDALLPVRDVRITAHPEIWSRKYAELRGSDKTSIRYVGIPFKRELLESLPNVEFNYITDFKEIEKGVFFSGEIAERDKEFEVPDPRLKVLKEDKVVEDPFLDDVSLLVDTNKGPVVILGCAHAGVINILNHFKRIGYKKFYAIIGGSHLGFVQDRKFLERVFDLMEEFSPDLLAFGHCTGFRVMCECSKRFKDRFVFPYVGWSVEF